MIGAARNYRTAAQAAKAFRSREEVMQYATTYGYGGGDAARQRVPIQFGLAACAAVLALAWSAGASAQAYPSKPIRLIVAQPPGGGNDTIARMIAERISKPLKQQVVVDNRAGASGLVAAELVAKSPPDGYTLLLGNAATLTIIPNLQKKVPYDALRDFEAVSLIASAPMLVVVHPSVPVRNIKELIAFAKARPGELNYASNGVGSSTHLATELFRQMTGINIVHVPYKGLAQAMTGLVSGQVPLMFSSAVAMMPHVRNQRLRALAMTGEKRSAAIPDIPTVAESGVPGFSAGSWYGVVVPTGTPRAVIDTLNREIVAATKSPEITDRLVHEGIIPIASAPDEFTKHIRTEFARVAKVVKISNLQVD
jgi:tripartite-type tricarboxylate transporter receptor subunit TctC